VDPTRLPHGGRLSDRPALWPRPLRGSWRNALVVAVELAFIVVVEVVVDCPRCALPRRRWRRDLSWRLARWRSRDLACCHATNWLSACSLAHVLASSCRGTGAGQGTQVKGHRSKDTCQRTHVKGHRSKDTGQRTQVKGHRSKDTGQGTQVKGHRSRDTGQGTQVKGRRTTDVTEQTCAKTTTSQARCRVDERRLVRHHNPKTRHVTYLDASPSRHSPLRYDGWRRKPHQPILRLRRHQPSLLLAATTTGVEHRLCRDGMIRRSRQGWQLHDSRPCTNARRLVRCGCCPITFTTTAA